MFAVGDQLVQVIGPQHAVRLCTKLRLQDIKAAAAVGDASAQRSYFELTAGRGIFTHLDRTNGAATITFAADRARPHAPRDPRRRGH
jgi:GTP-sensing pleiotropic transcriptional regulator CodY